MKPAWLPFDLPAASALALPIRFTFMRDGKTVAAGPVQGSGGLVGAGCAVLAESNPDRLRQDSLARIRLAVRRIERGHDPGIYCPAPGCLLVDGRLVDVRGLTVEVAP